MKVLVFEPNLFWSSRLMKSLKALGHEAVLARPGSPAEGEAALVNLGESSLQVEELVPRLRESRVYVIGHAGHKEKNLRELGQRIGCDRIASNSELTFKLDSLLSEAAGASSD